MALEERIPRSCISEKGFPRVTCSIQLPELQRRAALRSRFVHSTSRLTVLRFVLALVRNGLSEMALTCDREKLRVSWSKECAPNGICKEGSASIVACRKGGGRTRRDLERSDGLDVLDVKLGIVDRHQAVLQFVRKYASGSARERASPHHRTPAMFQTNRR